MGLIIGEDGTLFNITINENNMESFRGVSMISRYGGFLESLFEFGPLFNIENNMESFRGVSMISRYGGGGGGFLHWLRGVRTVSEWWIYLTGFQAKLK